MVPVRKVRVLGKDYQLSPASGRQFSDNDNYGQVTHGTLTILYSVDQSPAQLKDTIIHEVLHGIDFALQTELDERRVHALASGLYAFMVENKKLIRWIIGDRYSSNGGSSGARS